MQILIISGFLGAGKTTFIKELIKRTDKRPVIMENEYGANNLDSLELQTLALKTSGDDEAVSEMKTSSNAGVLAETGNTSETKNATAKPQEIKVLEFMEGCVCCTMKDSFVNSVMAIFSSLCPEYLIIEPTGVGRLSSIKENLEPILGRVNFLLAPIVIVSPMSFRQNMKEWPELYTDQIAAASRVVFSKCENASAEEILSVAEEIRKINPAAEIVRSHYSQMEDEWWENLWEPDVSKYSAIIANARNRYEKDNAYDVISAKTVDAEQEKNAPHARTESTSADISDSVGSSINKGIATQVSIDHAGVHNPAQLMQFLEDCLRGEFGLVTRAKGTIRVGTEMLRFDLADRMYAITDSPDAESQCVFIGKNLDEKGLRNRLGAGYKNIMRKIIG